MYQKRVGALSLNKEDQDEANGGLMPKLKGASSLDASLAEPGKRALRSPGLPAPNERTSAGPKRKDSV